MCTKATLKGWRVGALLSCALAWPARADVIYEYTGAPFACFPGTDSCVDGLRQCRLTQALKVSDFPPSNLDNVSLMDLLNLGIGFFGGTFTDGGTIQPTIFPEFTAPLI